MLSASSALAATNAPQGPKGGVILIVRHAENRDTGPALSTAGQQRAQACVHYFQNLTVDSKPLRPDRVIAAKDSMESQRPRLTIEPFAKAAGIEIDLRFKSNQSAKLAAALTMRTHYLSAKPRSP